MSPQLVMILVVGAIIVIQAMVWIPLVTSWNQKSAAFFADLEKEMAASGEKTLIALEKGNYEGATDIYGPVAGAGKVMLTDRRLVFRKLTGGVVEIPTTKIKASRENSAFNGVGRIGAAMFIIETTDPVEVGFRLGDSKAWKKALDGVIASA
ncbi:MAG: hypothetical protein ABI461_13285 [Polyangiaceae bacterium]